MVLSIKDLEYADLENGQFMPQHAEVEENDKTPKERCSIHR